MLRMLSYTQRESPVNNEEDGFNMENALCHTESRSNVAHKGHWCKDLNTLPD